MRRSMMLKPAGRGTLIVLAALFFSGAHAPHVGTARQLQERAVKKVAWRKEPVKLVKLKVKGSAVEVGKKFLGEDDWLRGFSVGLKNTSDKTVVWLDIALNFPRAEAPSAEPAARDHLVYGSYPPPPGETATQHPQQPPVRPGETVELTLADYEGTLEFLREANYPPSIKQVELDISEVIFDDGMMWSGDAFFRRDLNNPERWNRINEPQGEAMIRQPVRLYTDPTATRASLSRRPNTKSSSSRLLLRGLARTRR